MDVTSIVKPVTKPVDPCERETVITYDNASDEAVVYTWDQRINTHMTKVNVEPVETYTNDGRAVAWLYRVPKRWVAVRRPKRMPSRENVGKRKETVETDVSSETIR